MESLNIDLEILEKVDVLRNKYELILVGVVNSDIVPSEEQRERLIEQLDSITSITNRFIKNLILLLGDNV